MSQQTEPVQVMQVDSDLALKLAEMFTNDPVWVADIEPLIAAHRVAAERAARERVLREEFEPWKAKIERAALERAAQEIDQCNREGPYNAIQCAARIRALIPATPAAQTGEKK